MVAERDTDRYQQARRATRLTLAAETQWQLLPGRSSRRREYALGAQLEPAYAIRGDGYDWAATGTGLALTVVNGMGEGIGGGAADILAVNALRNARRAGIGLADQAALADQAVYAQHRGESYVCGPAAVLRVRHRPGDGRGRRLAADLAAPRPRHRADRGRGRSCRWACSRRPPTSRRASRCSPATGW